MLAGREILFNLWFLTSYLMSPKLPPKCLYMWHFLPSSPPPLFFLISTSCLPSPSAPCLFSPTVSWDPTLITLSGISISVLWIFSFFFRFLSLSLQTGSVISPILKPAAPDFTAFSSVPLPCSWWQFLARAFVVSLLLALKFLREGN